MYSFIVNIFPAHQFQPGSQIAKNGKKHGTNYLITILAKDTWKSSVKGLRLGDNDTNLYYKFFKNIMASDVPKEILSQLYFFLNLPRFGLTRLTDCYEFNTNSYKQDRKKQVSGTVFLCSLEGWENNSTHITQCNHQLQQMDMLNIPLYTKGIL